VKLLLDTHVVLWWRSDSAKLTRTVRRAIASADVVLVSAASGWEVALKLGVGKLRLGDSFAWMVSDSKFTELPVALTHTEQLTALPKHHRDPFDRMLIAQAQVEGATLVTHDRQFKPYDVPVVWV
jgi:PIN domain nuclease of toxin-antitoxin system